MGLFTLHNCCVYCSFDYLKSQFVFKSRLLIPEFSGYHGMNTNNLFRKHIKYVCNPFMQNVGLIGYDGKYNNEKKIKYLAEK